MLYTMKNLLQKDLFVLIFLLFIGVVNFLAMTYSWYWTFRWFDIPMHFLGGCWIAVLFFWLFNKKLNQKYREILEGNFLISLILCLGFVSLVGVLWELFEFSLDHFILAKNSILIQGDLTDTIKDLFMDLAGGFTIVFFYKTKLERTPSFSNKNSPEL